ncbi:hypothetical protein C8Q80DRAFT_864067 [Daedaleopsis nitida]|nr:hypothetical protein C8Q80DRAFT_864067 [Daedaleopsis nitida]
MIVETTRRRSAENSKIVNGWSANRLRFLLKRDSIRHYLYRSPGSRARRRCAGYRRSTLHYNTLTIDIVHTHTRPGPVPLLPPNPSDAGRSHQRPHTLEKHSHCDPSEERRPLCAQVVIESQTQLRLLYRCDLQDAVRHSRVSALTRGNGDGRDSPRRSYQGKHSPAPASQFIHIYSRSATEGSITHIPVLRVSTGRCHRGGSAAAGEEAVELESASGTGGGRGEGCDTSKSFVESSCRRDQRP